MNYNQTSNQQFQSGNEQTGQPAQQAQPQAQPQQQPIAQPNQQVQQTQQPAAQEPQAQPQPVQPVTPSLDRTQEQFNKLLESNRKLNEMNEELRQKIQPASSTQSQPQQPAQSQVDINDFVVVDPVSGERYVNDQKLVERMKELDEKARKAEDAVNRFIQTSEEREQRRQEQEAFNAHPELNPSSEKHNRNFAQQVRAAVLDSLAYPNDYGGQPLSFKQAADRIKNSSGNNQTGQAQAQEQPEGQQPAQPAQSQDGQQQQGQPAQGQPSQQPVVNEQKAQASANFNSQPQNAPQPVMTQEIQQARTATRKGNSDALIARLENIDHVIPFNGVGQE